MGEIALTMKLVMTIRLIYLMTYVSVNRQYSRRQRKQPDRYGFSNAGSSGSVVDTDELSLEKALKGPEKQQWSDAVMNYKVLMIIMHGKL